jgi:hypothetical protein
MTTNDLNRTTHFRNPEARKTEARRDALQRGLIGVAGAVMFWMSRESAHAQATKLAKAAVQYVEGGNFPGKDCDDCTYYLAGAQKSDPASCKIVEGPISPHGHCIAFSPRA